MKDTMLVLCAMGALLVRIGLAIHDTGLLRSKNSAGAILRSLADLCIATMMFWLVGSAIVNTTAVNGVFGLSVRLLAAVTGGPESARILVMLSGVLLACGIVVGAVAERSRFFPMLCISALLAGFIVPVAGYWVWNPNGWLGAKFGLHYIDTAGASVLHLTGGLTAAVAAIGVGPRAGKYNRDGSCNAIPGHSVPLASSGVLLMLVGWLPYVMGFALMRNESAAAAGTVGLNVILAGAAGALAAMALCQLRYGKSDIHLICGGMLGGLVAVSAAADQMGMRSATFIGLAAGVCVPMLTVIIELFWRIDDTTGAVAVHAGGGAIGALGAGFLVNTESLLARFKGLGVQAIGVAAISALAIFSALLLMSALKWACAVRAKDADEFDGLDLAEHDIGAYPDFQQNTIKSYHLREM